jgi:hypothetical protein
MLFGAGLVNRIARLLAIARIARDIVFMTNGFFIG